MPYIELYSKNPEDVDYNETQMEESDEYLAYLQQIRNILFPKVGSIFGAQQMPVDLEAYIFSLGINPKQLERIITEKINTYCTLTKYFPTTVSVTYAKGNVRQIAIVDLAIAGQRGYKVKIT